MIFSWSTSEILEIHYPDCVTYAGIKRHVLFHLRDYKQGYIEYPCGLCVAFNGIDGVKFKRYIENKL